MTTVADLMSRHVFTVDVHDDLADADRLMRMERVRHVPVVRNGKLAGLITHRDVLRAQTKVLMLLATPSEGTTVVELTAGTMMTENVRTVSPTTPAAEAARLLLDNRFGCLPVVDDDEQLIGIVTEIDFLRWSLDHLDQAD